MAYSFKPYRELRISDDYMFGIIMRQEKYAKPFLEALLQKKIARMEYADVQKDLPAAYESHGIRLDVYIEDEAGTVYDIEMQTTVQKSLEKRVRYYQSGLDRWQLDKGADYPELHDTYVIFVLLSDYFGEGYAKYEPVTYITTESETRYQNGAKAIFLNAAYRIPNADREILNFLDYVRGKTAETMSSAYIHSLEQGVEQAKQDENEEAIYMTWRIKMQDERRMGREEGILLGRSEGIQLGRSEGIQQGVLKGEADLWAHLVASGAMSAEEAQRQKESYAQRKQKSTEIQNDSTIC